MARPKPKTTPRVCERCRLPFGSRESDKYCKECKRTVLAEMKERGYLTSVPWQGRAFKKSDSLYCSDNNREPNPSAENAVRAMEDG